MTLAIILLSFPRERPLCGYHHIVWVYPMSAVANIVLNDAQATPVAHTFVPLGPDSSGVWWFEDQTGTASIAYNRISLQLVRPGPAAAGMNSDKRVARVKLGIHTPKVEALGVADSGYTPSPTIAYTPRCNIELIMSERSVLQDRKDLRKYAQFLLAETQVVNMAEALQNVF